MTAVAECDDFLSQSVLPVLQQAITKVCLTGEDADKERPQEMLLAALEQTGESPKEAAEVNETETQKQFGVLQSWIEALIASCAANLPHTAARDDIKTHMIEELRSGKTPEDILAESLRPRKSD